MNLGKAEGGTHGFRNLIWHLVNDGDVPPAIHLQEGSLHYRLLRLPLEYQVSQPMLSIQEDRVRAYRKK